MTNNQLDYAIAGVAGASSLSLPSLAEINEYLALAVGLGSIVLVVMRIYLTWKNFKDN